MTRNRLFAVAAFVGLLALMLAWWLRAPEAPRDAPSTPADTPRARTAAPPNAPAPRPATPPKVVVAEGGPEAWFPDHELHRCRAPSDVPTGHYRAGAGTVLVRDGAVLVAADGAGEGPVLDLGTAIGHLTWEAGTCVWGEPFRFDIVGEVVGGGEHIIAGCPVGETVRSDASGRFRTTAVEGQPCVLRVVDVDGTLSMGEKVFVTSDQDENVQLMPAEPLDPEQVELAGNLLARLVAAQITKAEGNARRWSAIPGDDPWVVWMRAQAAEEVAFFEAEQARLDDPDTARDAVVELLLGSNN